jgi:hypothetical protein
VRDSEISDDLVDEDVVRRDIPHSSQLHGSRGVCELEGFEPSADSVREFEDSDVTNLSPPLFAGFLVVIEAVGGVEAGAARSNDGGLEVSIFEDFGAGFSPRFKNGVDSGCDGEARSVDEVSDDVGVVSADLIDFLGLIQHHNCRLGEQRVVLSDPSSTLNDNALVGSIEVVNEGFSALVE